MFNTEPNCTNFSIKPNESSSASGGKYHGTCTTQQNRSTTKWETGPMVVCRDILSGILRKLRTKILTIIVDQTVVWVVLGNPIVHMRHGHADDRLASVPFCYLGSRLNIRTLVDVLCKISPIVFSKYQYFY